jgi:hypothetical protein
MFEVDDILRERVSGMRASIREQNVFKVVNRTLMCRRECGASSKKQCECEQC